MDRAKIRQMEKEVSAILWAFGDIEKKYGVKVKLGGGSYCETSWTLKMEFSEVGAGGIVLDRTAADFKVLAPLYGMSAEDLGKSFTVGGKTFTICGLKSRASKQPIICSTPDGKRYKWSVDSIKAHMAFNKQKIAAPV